jgi:uncharacterized membrane protein
MKIDWRNEWSQLLLIGLMFALSIASWRIAPDRIPVHWGFDGQADRYGGRFEGLMVLPLVAAGVYLVLLFAPRIDPGRANYSNFALAYATLRLMALAVLAGLHGMVLLWIRGREFRMETVVGLLLGLLFVVIGNLMGKLRPNWFVGIRTPWTLSSKRSWVLTHRAGGWVFVAIGLLTMVAGVLRSSFTPLVLAIGAGAGVLGLVVYSYVVWRKDPEKVPPTGTLPA